MIAPASEGSKSEKILVTFESGPESVLVKIADCGESEACKVPLWEEIWNEVRQQRIYRVSIDLSGMNSLSTYVVRQLIAVGAQICDHGGMMQLSGLRRKDKVLLRTYGLRECVPAYSEKREEQLSQQAWRWK